MIRTWTILGIMTMSMAAGCQSMRHGGQAPWPAGVPTQATLIGGGISDDLRLPNDGLLYLVDPAANAAIVTMTVTADETVELNEETVFGALLTSRHGAYGIALVQALGGGEEVDEWPRDPLHLELYFIPLTELAKLTATDSPAATE